MRKLPKRAFVVEDEYFVLLDVKDALTRMGCLVVHATGSLEDALNWAGKVEADFAVIDVNLKGEKVYPVAELLAERGIPFIFCTGYEKASLDPAWAGHATIQKPFSVDELVTALENWLARLD
ncbi:MAG: response regulator [Rhizobiaceae bacterium]|nr:response regulator [Rhizobiaceae bacterium]